MKPGGREAGREALAVGRPLLQASGSGSPPFARRKVEGSGWAGGGPQGPAFLLNGLLRDNCLMEKPGAHGP